MLNNKHIFLFIFFLFLGKIPVFSQTSQPFILIGDTQRTLWMEFWREQNDDIREKIFPEIANQKPKALIILGDLVDWGASEASWKYFDKITLPIKEKNIPIYAVIGNHDYFGNNKDALKNISSHFSELKAKTWYIVEINSIAFIMLNSNLEELSVAERKNQKTWLDSILTYSQNNSQISNIVCCWHHPIYTNSNTVDDDIEVNHEFQPIIKKFNKVKLIASGHCHSYEHFKIDSIHYLISGGAGGPRQELLTKENSRHKDLYDGEVLRDFHYCLLDIKDKKLSIKMIRYNSKTNDWIQSDYWETE